MSTRKISFSFKGKRFNIKAKRCSIFSSGLMFRRRETTPCLFDLKKPSGFKITSLFVFFPFVAIWFDHENKVLDIKVVRPFKFEISPKKLFSKLLEIPINETNSKIVRSLVGGERFK